MKETLKKYLKFDNWWLYKIGSGIFTFIFISSILKGHLYVSDLKMDDLLLFACLVALAISGHLINDFSDYEIDKKVNKHNLLIQSGYKKGVVMLLAVSVLSIILSFLLSKLMLLLVLFQLICNCVYSLKPFRLKEKGYWAVWITGIYERVLPLTMIIVHLITPETGLEPLLLIVLITYLCWAFFWECRNYITGQMEDKENDVLSNVRTLAVIKEEKELLSLKKKLLVAEFLGLLGWLLAYAIMAPFNFLLIVILLVIPLFHQYIQKNTSIFKTTEEFVGYLYAHVLLSGMIICLLIWDQISFPVGITLILLFRSDYLYASWETFFIRLFYRSKYILSMVVNHTLFWLKKATGIFLKNNK